MGKGKHNLAAKSKKKTSNFYVSLKSKINALTDSMVMGKKKMKLKRWLD